MGLLPFETQAVLVGFSRFEHLRLDAMQAMPATECDTAQGKGARGGRSSEEQLKTSLMSDCSLVK